MTEEYEQQYRRLEESHWWICGRRQMVCQLVVRANPDRNGRILEVGCLGGLLLRQLRQQGYVHVTGIDISPAAIELCKARGIEDAHLMDAQKPAWADERFDVLIASDVLEHLVDDSQAIREWRRLLKPNGRFIVFVPAFPSLWSEHDEANNHYRRYRRTDLRQRLQTNGFILERSSYWNFFLFVPVALIRLLKRWLPRRKDATEQGDIFETPALINRVLLSLLRFENWCIGRGINWPFGVSVMAVARKPASHSATPSMPLRQTACGNDPSAAAQSRRQGNSSNYRSASA